MKIKTGTVIANPDVNQMINAMKKLILIFALMAGVSFSGNAQHFYASFGVQHNWGVPGYVSNVVYDNYYNYDWVHASRTVRNGRLFYDVVLQRGDIFLEVTVNRNGFIRGTRRWDAYPFVGHVCSNVCGFHGGFYRNSYTVYNNFNYGYRYRGNNTLIVNNYRAYNRYHNHGKHYQHRNHKVNRYDVNRRANNSRRATVESKPERRRTYTSSSRTRGRVDHGKRSSYEKGKRGDQKSRQSSGRSNRRSY